jgi:hypothetical protein
MFMAAYTPINIRMQIVDNFLDPLNFNKLKEFVESPDFPWFYVSHVSLPPGAEMTDPLAQETFGYNHMVYNEEDNSKSFVFSTMSYILSTFEETFGTKIKKLLRVRMGMKHPKIGFTEDNYNLPHVDYFFPHATLIYYINDSDGPTRIFDQVFTEQTGEPDKFTVKATVEPKANRMVYLENGLVYHTAANPITTDRRIVLNINLLL